MAQKILKSTFILILLITLFSFDLPTGWFKAGDQPDKYEMGVDKGSGQDGKNAATIKSVSKKIDGFGTLMQTCLPGKFLGKRVRMSGYIKSKDISDWAGLWLRIDKSGSDESLEFDNMHDGKKERSIKGTTDWKKYEIVLDVPNSATNMAYGALLVGTGQIWFDKLEFEVVDNSIPTTGMERDARNSTYEPTNLDFEK
jgi:hypothetical protein